MAIVSKLAAVALGLGPVGAWSVAGACLILSVNSTRKRRRVRKKRFAIWKASFRRSGRFTSRKKEAHSEIPGREWEGIMTDGPDADEILQGLYRERGPMQGPKGDFGKGVQA